MEEKELTTGSVKETEDVGYNFARNLKKGDLVVLSGALGAGKTVFTRGVAKGLNVKSRVISPTFMLLRKHRGKIGKEKINLYHIDLYRLDGQQSIKTLALDDIFEDVNGIFIIEWGKKNEDLKASWEIELEIMNEDKRKIKIKHE